MIITASRRTDIPAFYSEWFMNRLRAGYATVPNPFYPQSVSRISLSPEDVSAIVFCSKNPSPMLQHFPELIRSGFRFVFQVTLTGFGHGIEPEVPPPDVVIPAMRRISREIGPHRVIWRFDPILVTSRNSEEKVLETFLRISRELRGCTECVIVSFATFYQKVAARFSRCERETGIRFFDLRQQPERLGFLSARLAQIAGESGMTIQSCSSDVDLARFGIPKGSCVDPEFLNRIFGLAIRKGKAKGQRKDCGCAESRDVGMYDTCPHGCLYCYATNSFRRCHLNYERHNPAHEMLVAQKSLGGTGREDRG